jgi:ATPase subunit of ABC transporter with duplicated ATPase domains
MHSGDLESFIIGARMAMIVVSHDRYFIEKIGFSEIITIAK